MFVYSFTELFQVDSLGKFNTFVEKATQQKQWLEEYIALREQDAKTDERIEAIKNELQDSKTLFMKCDETIRMSEREADE